MPANPPATLRASSGHRSKQSRTARRLLALLASASLALAFSGALYAADPARPVVKLRGTLDFIRYGYTAPSDHAVARGYFSQYGLDVRFDASKGSQDAIVRIASGTYDVGTADIPTLIQFAAQNPAQAPRAVFLVLDRSPLAVTTLRKSSITRVSDLVGRTLAIGTTDGGSRLLPAFLHLNGVDPARVERKVVDVRVRDTLFLRGDVDGLVGNDYTVLFNMKALRVPTDTLAFMRYADHGMDLYGQAVVVSRALIERDPLSVRNYVRAMAHAWRDAAIKPQEVVQTVVDMDGTLDAAIETERLRYVVEQSILTPNVRRNGIGAYDPARLQRMIDLVVRGLDLARAPAIGEIYDDRFLPPIEERAVP